jgi:hypothetical protein
VNISHALKRRKVASHQATDNPTERKAAALIRSFIDNRKRAIESTKSHQAE